MTKLQTIADLNIEFNAKEIGTRPDDLMDDPRFEARNYELFISRENQFFVTYFSMGIGLNREPELLTVLDCLITDAFAGAETFEDFCSEFGYDTDSRRAERTWKACQETALNLSRLFPEFSRNELQEIVHNSLS